MKKQFTKFKKVLIAALVLVFVGACALVGDRVAKAAGEIGFSVSPMKQNIVLNPGDSYRGTFTVSNPATSENDFSYLVTVTPFYVKDDAEYTAVFDEDSDRTMISKWITLVSPSEGKIAPNESNEIEFIINVPEDAPAGGQYAAITVSSNNTDEAAEGSTGIREQIAIAHTIFAEIAGETVKKGEVTEVSVPSFIFSGDLTASSKVKNTGNVHGKAVYKLQVFPLFSSEEVFTNEEKPDEQTILPDRTLYYETAFKNTPSFGIYNVVYTVEFEGTKTEVKKMVIKCPIWMLFSILFAIIAAIIYIGLRIKARKR